MSSNHLNRTLRRGLSPETGIFAGRDEIPAEPISIFEEDVEIVKESAHLKKMRMSQFSNYELEDIRINQDNEVRQIILNMRSFGMTQKYISSISGIPERTIENWLLKGRAELKELSKDKNPDVSSFVIFTNDWEAAPGLMYHQIQMAKMQTANNENCPPALKIKILESIQSTLPAGIHETTESDSVSINKNLNVKGVLSFLPPPGLVLKEISEEEIKASQEEMEAEWRESKLPELDSQETVIQEN